MSATFFESKSVNIFPCARRGKYTEAGVDKIYNAESRFVSEANLTKLSGLAFGRDSYIISRPPAISEGGIWKLFIKGYYFELTIEKDELQEEGYFIIGLEDTSDISRIRLAALTEYSESSSSLKKIIIDTAATSLDDDKGKCRAICFISSDEEPSGDALYCVSSRDTLTALADAYAKAEAVADTVEALEAKDLELSTAIGNNTIAISTVRIDFEAADRAINTKIGDFPTGEGAYTTIVEGITSARTYAKNYADSLADNYDAAGTAANAAAQAKIDLIGDDDDTIYAKTIKGAKEYAKALVDDLTGRGDGETDDPESLAGETAERKAADLAINNKIGTAADGKDVATVYGAIAKAKSDAAEDAASKVNALATGQVATNKTDIAGLTTRIGNEETARAEADTALSNRLDTVEAFFEGAAADEGEGENLKNALDTLKEIQEFATGEGTAAQEMLDAIQTNADAIDALANETDGRVTVAEKYIKDLQGIVKDGGTLEVRVDDAQTRVGDVETRIDTAESTITSLGDNKLDKSVYETYIAGKDMSDADLQSYADGKASTAQANAEAEAARFDGVLKAELQKEINDKVVAAIEEVNENLQANYLSKTEVEGTLCGIYAVAFDLSGYSGDDLDADFIAATSGPIVFISGCSTLPSPPDNYAWFDSLGTEANKVEIITKNIILYLREDSISGDDSGEASVT